MFSDTSHVSNETSRMASRQPSTDSSWSSFRDHGQPLTGHRRVSSLMSNGSHRADGVTNAVAFNSPNQTYTSSAGTSSLTSPATAFVGSLLNSKLSKKKARMVARYLSQENQGEAKQDSPGNNYLMDCQLSPFNLKAVEGAAAAKSSFEGIETGCVSPSEKSLRGKFVKFMKDHCQAIQASYNSRSDDSIFALGFERHSVVDNDDEIQPDAALSLDLSKPKEVALAMQALERPESGTILECNTFQQMVFLKALASVSEEERRVIFDNLAELTGKYSKKMVIHPLNIKSVRIQGAHVEFQDFMNFLPAEHAEDKKTPEELEGDERELEIGDIIYVENYSNYPEEGNGNYSGEWCLVLDTTVRKDPLLYGFGVESVKYSELVELLDVAYHEEVAQLEGGTRRATDVDGMTRRIAGSGRKSEIKVGRKQSKSSKATCKMQPVGKIGIVDCFKLNRLIFGEL